MYSLVFCLTAIGSSLVVATPETDAQAAIAIAQAKEKKPVVHQHLSFKSYVEAGRESVTSGRGLIVFIDCKPLVARDYDLLLVYNCGAGEWFDLTKEQLRGVVISYPDGNGGLYRGAKDLPASVTWDEIGVEMGKLRKAILDSISPKEKARGRAGYRTQDNSRSFDGGRVETLYSVPFQSSSRTILSGRGC